MSATPTFPPGLAALAAQRQWVVCGDDKVPLTPSLDAPLAGAKANDPTTWRDAALASACVGAGLAPLVGYEFAAGDDYWGIDIDGCLDPATGTLTNRARAILALADTYAEPSAGRRGLHIIGCGPLPQRMIAAGQQGKKRGHYECYASGRYFRMTLDPSQAMTQCGRLMGRPWNLSPASCGPTRTSAPPWPRRHHRHRHRLGLSPTTPICSIVRALPATALGSPDCLTRGTGRGRDTPAGARAAPRSAH